jgi:aldose 1-epimerase
MGDVSVQSWGQTPAGEPVQLFTLTNNAGFTVRLTDYGATIVEVWTPDRQGTVADVCLGFDHLAAYTNPKNPYVGCLVGRCANRIRDGKFTLEGKPIQLTLNEKANSLHGGKNGFDKRVWMTAIVSQNPPAVKMTLHSPDGDQGYPGNLNISVTYKWTDHMELEMLYEAETDRTTVVNLTNHAYFNLAGEGAGLILDHEAQIHAEIYTPADDSLLPTGALTSVADTPFDFRKFQRIGDRLQQAGGNPVGYDLNYMLQERFPRPYGPAARVRHPDNGRWLEVQTDQPGLQFYTGNFLNGTLLGKSGKLYPQYGGFCLETQHFPDSPNRPEFPPVILSPGQKYRTRTAYVFGVQ